MKNKKLRWKKHEKGLVDESETYYIFKNDSIFTLYKYCTPIKELNLQRDCKAHAESLVNRGFSGKPVDYNCSTGDIVKKDNKMFFVRDTYTTRAIMVKYGTTKLLNIKYSDMEGYTYA